MATCTEDYLIDDDVLTRQFSGTLSFDSETASSQATVDVAVYTDRPSGAEKLDDRASRPGPVSISFEIIDAQIVHDNDDKHVVYTVLMVRSDMAESSPTKISRRYSDFSRLNTALRRRYPALTRDISFPGKRLSGNFKPSTIALRSRAFEQYLTHMFAVGALRTSAELAEFLYGDDLREGYRQIVDGDYKAALAPLRSAWRLQTHLHGDTDPEVTATLCAIVAAHAALEDYRAACAHADRVLECFYDSMTGTDVCSPYLVPILQLMIRMSWKLGRDKRRSEAKLDELRQNNVDIDSAPTLLELVVNRFYK